MEKFEKVGFSPVEVETTFSMRTGTLANMRARGEGPKFYKIGRKVIYLREDLEAFIRREPVLTKDSIELTM